MKNTQVTILFLSLVLIGGLVTAGCVQGSSDNAGSALSPTDTGQAPASAGPGTDTQASAMPTGQGSGTHQFHGGFLSNATLINSAAAKLDVSSDALAAALNSTGGRPNLTAAAQQLGVTQQQLTDALGFPAGGFHGRNSTSAPPPMTQG